MKIVHVTGVWYTNIGNAFIDYGAKYILQTAFPDADIQFCCESTLQRLEFVDVDLLTFGGACLNENLEKRIKAILEIKKYNKNMKTICLGAGQWEYSKKEIEIVKKALNILKPSLLITRDPITFDNLKSVSNVYRGIDCAFYLSDYYTPLKTNIEFEVFTPVTFEYCRRMLPIINNDEKLPLIISLHNHEFNSKFFTSDIPEDYLFLYANASRVFSNRVHGCIASHSYDTKYDTNLLNKTERETLFDEVKDNYEQKKIDVINKVKGVFNGSI